MDDLPASTLHSAQVQYRARRERLHPKEIARFDMLHARTMADHAHRDAINRAVMTAEDAMGTGILVRNEAERRMEMMLALSERRIIDDEAAEEHGGASTGNLEWLLRQYADSLSIAAAMAFGIGRMITPHYEGIHMLGGQTPLAHMHEDLLVEGAFDQDAMYFNLARILMAVNDVARQQTLHEGGPVKALSEPWGSYDQALYESFLRTRLFDRIKTARLMKDETVTDDEPIDSGAIYSWDDETLVVHMDNEARRLSVDASPREHVLDLGSVDIVTRAWMDERNADGGAIRTCLSNGIVAIHDKTPKTMRFDVFEYQEGRYADPASRIQPSTWSWGNRFQGRLRSGQIPGIQRDVDMSIEGLGDGMLGIHGTGTIVIYPSGAFQGSFDGSPLFSDIS